MVLIELTLPWALFKYENTEGQKWKWFFFGVEMELLNWYKNMIGFWNFAWKTRLVFIDYGVITVLVLFFSFWYLEKLKQYCHVSFSSILFVAWTFWLWFFGFTWRVGWLSVHPLLAVVFCKHSVFSPPWSRNHVTSVGSPGRRDLSPNTEDCIKDVRFTSAMHAIGQPVTAIGERVQELLTVSSSRQVVSFAMFSPSWTTWQVYFHERGRTEGD